MTHASLCKKTYRTAFWLLAYLVLSPGLSAANLMITSSALPAGMTGTAYSFQLTATGGTPPYTWYGDFVVPGITLNQTGLLSGIPTKVGTYSLPITVVDSAMDAAQSTLQLSVGPCVPTIINTSPLPGGDLNIHYSVSLIGSGCSGGYQYSVQPDPFVLSALPQGLSLANGIISGFPQQTGTFSFTITITDSAKDSAIYPFSLTINPLPQITTPATLPSGSVGSPYSLTIQASGGTPPYIFSMNQNPPGLTLTPAGVLSGTAPKAGTFSFTMGVTDSLGGQSSSTFQVTFGNSVLLINPSSLSFSVPAGGSAPLSQSLSIIPGNKAALPAAYQIQFSTGQQTLAAAAPPSWLNVAPTTGDAPASLLVSVDQGTMPAGAYNGQITVLDPKGIPTQVPVTLTVAGTAAPQLSVIPGLLRFAARAAAPGTLTQNLWITNNGSGSLGFSASVTGGSSWISLQPASSQTAPNLPVLLQVIVNTEGLGIGAYRDVVHVSSAAGSADIPVALFVAGNGPILGVNTTGLLFQTVQGDDSTSSRTVEVLNQGDPNATLQFTPTLATNASWLNLGALNSGAPMTAPAALPLVLSPNASLLSSGAYYSLLEISDPNALNSPQYVTVVLNVEASASTPVPDLSPAGLFFIATADGSAPEAQQVTVNTSSSKPVPFQVAASTPDSSTWLGASITSGNASGQSAGIFNVTVSPAGLSPGIYTGNVNVSMEGTMAGVNVTFVVLPGTATTASVRSHVTSPGCTPSKLALTETGMVNNFALPAGWPATLIAQLNDDCGNSVTNGAVVASFSDGDAPLTLHGDSLGSYSATWQPGAVTPQMSITLNATSGSLQPATALLTGGVAQNTTQPPTLPGNGVVNAFNVVNGGALSPGTIAEVFGTGLASSTVISTGAPPVPRSFNGTQMLVGGLAAPLYYLSSGQLNAQLPAELAPNQQYMAVVSANGALTLPIQLDFVPLQPGVAAYTTGYVIAQHANYTLITSSSPAKPGEVILIYLLGMGPTNPPVASGAAAPSSEPLARVTAQPVVTVGGQAASVAFAGLTPGDAGLYQIDFTVPPGASSGDLDLIVTQNGVASNTTKLPVAQ